MSGGYFGYDQYRMENIADEIDKLIDQDGNEEKSLWGASIGYRYPPSIIERFKGAAHTIRQAQEMAQRIDWLVSGDDGEESFMKRWDKEVREYFQEVNK